MYLQNNDCLFIRASEGCSGQTISGPIECFQDVIKELNGYDAFEADIISVHILRADGVVDDVTDDFARYEAAEFYKDHGEYADLPTTHYAYEALQDLISGGETERSFCPQREWGTLNKTMQGMVR